MFQVYPSPFEEYLLAIYDDVLGIVLGSVRG